MAYIPNANGCKIIMIRESVFTLLMHLAFDKKKNPQSNLNQ